MNVNTAVASNFGDQRAKFETVWRDQIDSVKERFGSAIEEICLPGEAFTDVPILIVKLEKTIELLTYLKNDSKCDYNFLSDFTASDESPREPRFDLIYNLFSASAQKYWRIRVKTKVTEGQPAPTAIDIWPGANWAEREIWDMFGIKFTGHPDLRRILMDNRWQGHPLRKDYPLRGYQIFPNPEETIPELLQDGEKT